MIKSAQFGELSTNTVMFHGVHLNSNKTKEECEQPVGNFTDFVQCLKLILTSLMEENQGQVII